MFAQMNLKIYTIKYVKPAIIIFIITISPVIQIQAHGASLIFIDI